MRLFLKATKTMVVEPMMKRAFLRVETRSAAAGDGLRTAIPWSPWYASVSTILPIMLWENSYGLENDHLTVILYGILFYCDWCDNSRGHWVKNWLKKKEMTEMRGHTYRKSHELSEKVSNIPFWCISRLYFLVTISLGFYFF